MSDGGRGPTRLTLATARRVAVGLAAAAGGAGLLGCLFGPVFGLIVLMFATAHAVVLGAPLALAAARLGLIRLWTSVVGGLVVGAAPVGVVVLGGALVSVLKHPGPLTQHETGEGVGLTLVTFVAGTGVFGVAGACGGVLFWIAWRSQQDEATPAAAAADAQAGTAPLDPPSPGGAKDPP